MKLRASGSSLRCQAGSSSRILGAAASAIIRSASFSIDRWNTSRAGRGREHEAGLAPLVVLAERHARAVLAAARVLQAHGGEAEAHAAVQRLQHRQDQLVERGPGRRRASGSRPARRPAAARARCTACRSGGSRAPRPSPASMVASSSTFGQARRRRLRVRLRPAAAGSCSQQAGHFALDRRRTARPAGRRRGSSAAP